MHYTIQINRTVAALIALAGCTVGLYAAEPGPTPANVFQPLDRAVTRVPIGPEVVARQPVQVNLALLAGQRVGATLNLNALGDRPITGVVERVDRRSPRRFTIAGRVDGHQHGSFTFVVHETVAVGVIRLPEFNEVYQLRYTPEGVHLFQQVDPSAYPREQCYHGGGDPIDRPSAPTITGPPGAAEPGSGRGGCEAPPPVYDLLIPYTHLARQAMGSTDAAIAQCQLAVEVGNEAYANSAIDVRLRLVHTMEVEYDEPIDLPWPDYMEAWLDWLRVNPSIGAARADYRADFICMLTDGGSGIGFCGPGAVLAFSCSQWDRAVTSWTLVHEMGHNQGCAHNRGAASRDCPDSSYAYGHRFMGSDGIEYGTVMAYGANRIAHFSNPDIEFMGYPTGVPIGEDGEAHCAMQHNIWIYDCEAYRATRYDIWVDFDHTSTEHGSFDLPYNTVAEGVDRILNGVGATEPPNLWIKAGSTDESVTVDKAMIIRSCGGLVTIGN